MARYSRRQVLQRGATLAALSFVPGCGMPALPWQRPKVYRVGLLGLSAADPAEARWWQAFRLGLRERGWVEGENILLEYRWAEGDPARLSGLAADLVRLPVDLIVARSSIFVQPAKEATSSIPIVFMLHADPVGLGHVASLAQPGGNITGLSMGALETDAKRLELLTTADPGIKRVAVLWSPDQPSNAPSLKAVEEAGRTLRLDLQAVAVRTGAELEGDFAAIAREQAQAVLVLGAALFIAEGRRVAELAMRHRLPTMFNQREAVAAGGLMSYTPDFDDLMRRGAGYVDKILKGARPAEIPVEFPAVFDFVINLKTARAIGLTIPESVLQQATELIE
jgi:putative ABC transport system substrate-binding protein